VARIQTGETLNFGNVRLVGMTVDEFRDAVGLRVGANGQLYILPDDILENTVRAFAVSATSANGYGAQGVPAGRYLAPANGPDCIETAPGYGDCGLRNLIVHGPRLVRFDIGAGKKFRIKGNVSFEFRGEMLNVFNEPYFNPGAPNAPQTTAGLPLGMTNTYSTTGTGGPVATVGSPLSNPTAGSSVDSFRLTQLLGDNTSRLMQLIWRVRW
jgi:hypothetical protein